MGEKHLQDRARQENERTTETEEAAKNQFTVSMTVESSAIGKIIGPSGKTLNELKEKTGVTRIDTTSGIITIIGQDRESVKQCEVAIRELETKGFCSMQYEKFSETTVMVHPVHFPDIIGRSGATIKKIKEELNVVVS